jgi:hypothetical protein
MDVGGSVTVVDSGLRFNKKIFKNKIMHINKKILVILVLLVLIALTANVFLVRVIMKEREVAEQQQINTKVLAFRDMFTQKVLLADGEVDFDTRLALETSVRNLNDTEVFAGWQVFTKSADKTEATANAKKLLELLIRKTSK